MHYDIYGIAYLVKLLSSQKLVSVVESLTLKHILAK